MGTSGLEPPTSRLSGVRSNHLSYAPKLLLRNNPQVFLSSFLSLFLLIAKPKNLNRVLLAHCRVYSVSSGPLHNYEFWILNYESPQSHGGDEEDRTPDPLLAKQVLSQLSYTPV